MYLKTSVSLRLDFTAGAKAGWLHDSTCFCLSKVFLLRNMILISCVDAKVN
jgi:hypothetical protein